MIVGLLHILEIKTIYLFGVFSSVTEFLPDTDLAFMIQNNILFTIYIRTTLFHENKEINLPKLKEPMRKLNKLDQVFYQLDLAKNLDAEKGIKVFVTTDNLEEGGYSATIIRTFKIIEKDSK